MSQARCNGKKQSRRDAWQEGEGEGSENSDGAVKHAARQNRAGHGVISGAQGWKIEQPLQALRANPSARQAITRIALTYARETLDQI